MQAIQKDIDRLKATLSAIPSKKIGVELAQAEKVTGTFAKNASGLQTALTAVSAVSLGGISQEFAAVNASVGKINFKGKFNEVEAALLRTSALVHDLGMVKEVAPPVQQVTQSFAGMETAVTKVEIAVLGLHEEMLRLRGDLTLILAQLNKVGAVASGFRVVKRQPHPEVPEETRLEPLPARRVPFLRNLTKLQKETEKEQANIRQSIGAYRDEASKLDRQLQALASTTQAGTGAISEQASKMLAAAGAGNKLTEVYAKIKAAQQAAGVAPGGPTPTPAPSEPVVTKVVITPTALAETQKRMKEIAAIDVGGPIKRGFAVAVDGAKRLDTALDKIQGKMNQLGQSAKRAFLIIAGGAIGLTRLANPPKFDDFIVQIRVLGAQIGAIFVPAIEKITAGLRQLNSMFAKLTDRQKESIARWAGIALAVLGVAIILPKLVFLVRAVSTAVLFLNAALIRLSVSNPFGWIAIAIGAIITLVLAIGGLNNAVEGEGGFFGGLIKFGKAVKDIFQPIINAWLDFFDKLTATFGAFIDALNIDVEKIKLIMEGLAVVLTFIFDAIVAAIQVLMKTFIVLSSVMQSVFELDFANIIDNAKAKLDEFDANFEKRLAKKQGPAGKVGPPVLRPEKPELLSIAEAARKLQVAGVGTDQEAKFRRELLKVNAEQLAKLNDINHNLKDQNQGLAA